jgi:hypothetical protein
VREHPLGITFSFHFCVQEPHLLVKHLRQLCCCCCCCCRNTVKGVSQFTTVHFTAWTEDECWCYSLVVVYSSDKWMNKRIDSVKNVKDWRNVQQTYTIVSRPAEWLHGVPSAHGMCCVLQPAFSLSGLVHHRRTHTGWQQKKLTSATQPAQQIRTSNLSSRSWHGSKVSSTAIRQNPLHYPWKSCLSTDDGAAYLESD